MSRRLALALLAAILAVAAFLRLRGMAFDLPYVFHPDEPFNIAIIRSILRGDPNPHFFVYPSLLYYVEALAYRAYALLGSAVGALPAHRDVEPLLELAMGANRAPQPDVVLLYRVVSAGFGVASAALVYCAGRRLLGSAAIGLVAALLVAVAPTQVEHSRYVTPDSLVVFLASAVLLASAWIQQRGRVRDYAIGGILVGLAASTKYNAALLAIAIVAAHLLAAPPRSHRLLAVAALASALAFVAATPYALLDFATFFAFLRVDGSHYARGHPGMEGDSLRWYVAYMADTAAIVYVLACVEAVRGVVARSRPLLLLAAFPVLYFAFIASFEVRNDRTFLPATPFLFLLAASCIVTAGHALRVRATTPRVRAFAELALALAVLGVVVQPMTRTIAQTRKLLTPDSRVTARAWVPANIPAASSVAIESYAPFVEPTRYRLTSLLKLIDHDPGWFAAQGIRYVIASEGMYGRYFREPARYASEVRRYRQLFDAFRLVRRFDDGGYEVRVYEVTDNAASSRARP